MEDSDSMAIGRKRARGRVLPRQVLTALIAVWRPSAERRDLRQLLIHGHKRVGIRARVKNGLQP
jgi:hypothetical protein